MTGELVERAKGKAVERVKAAARRIATEAPHLADLPAADLDRLARAVVAEELKGELKQAADLERIDYPAERETFISRASRTGSARTRDLYGRALGRLEAWCSAQGISPLELTPARADDWIADLRGQGRAPATVNVDVAAASSFWTWLERRHTELRNPFRGTRARPPRKAARILEVPGTKEIRRMEAAADPVLRAAIVLMAQGGLRVGALPSLSITGARWTATTKGKEQSGQLPAEARDALTRAGLSLRRPFEDLTATRLLDRFRYLSGKLYAAGKLQARYSVHDLRHAFAVRLYRATKGSGPKAKGDIYQVKEALGHANVGVTETYLRSLGVTD